MKFIKVIFSAIMIGVVSSCTTTLTAKLLGDNWKYSPDQMMIGVRGPVKSMEYTYSEPVTWEFIWPVCTPDGSIFQRCYRGSYKTNDEEFYGYISFDPQYNFTHYMYLGDNDSIQFAQTKLKPKYNSQNGSTKIWLERNDSSMISSIGTKYEIGDDWPCEDLYWWHYNCDKLISYVNICHSDAFYECTCSYSYDNDDNLQTIVVCNKGGQDLMPWNLAIVEYSDYKLDHYGNWTSRKAKVNIQYTAEPYRTSGHTQAPENAEWTEYRTIKYYKK